MNSLGATVSMLPSNSMTNAPRSAFPQRSSKRSEGSAEQLTVLFQSYWFLIVSFDLCCTGADPVVVL